MNTKNLKVQARIWLMEQRIREAVKFLDGSKMKHAQLLSLRSEYARLLAEKERKGL